MTILHLGSTWYCNGQHRSRCTGGLSWVTMLALMAASFPPSSPMRHLSIIQNFLISIVVWVPQSASEKHLGKKQWKDFGPDPEKKKTGSAPALGQAVLASGSESTCWSNQRVFLARFCACFHSCYPTKSPSPNLTPTVNPNHQPCSGLGRPGGSCDAVCRGPCIGADQTYPQIKVPSDCKRQEFPPEPDPPVRHSFENQMLYTTQQKNRNCLLNLHHW